MTHCLNDGASLVAPASKDEHENVVKLLPSSLDKSIWIGLHNFYKANKYLTSKGRLPRFTNWQAGQPNFSRSIQNRCVMMDNTHKYRNEECGARHMFVCAAKECKKNFANKACMTNDKGYKLSTQLNRCYKTYTTPSSWNEAFDKCEADNARLAVINSEEEAKFLKSIFKSTECSFSSITCDSSQAFIGMTDFLAPGMMLTIDGKTPAASGYDKWHSRIQSRKLADKCGTLHRFGELSRVSCDKKLGFICEKIVPTSTC